MTACVPLPLNWSEPRGAPSVTSWSERFTTIFGLFGSGGYESVTLIVPVAPGETPTGGWTVTRRVWFLNAAMGNVCDAGVTCQPAALGAPGWSCVASVTVVFVEPELFMYNTNAVGWPACASA